jgi:DNA-binding NarL/FixJ family response regulator
MTKRVFIIHSSEIVRKGIMAILRNYFNFEYQQFQSISEIGKELNDFENCLIITFIELADSIDQSFLRKLQEKNLVKTIGVSKNSIESVNIYGFSNCISLNTSSKNIVDLVSTILKENEHPTNKKYETSELSVREKDVLKLVALGNSNKDIAEKLFISIHTVISHRKNITEKLGIKSISGLTVYAIINKLIDTESINPEQLI